MFKKLFFATAISVAFIAPAAAASCPAQMAKIDAAMATTDLNAADKAKVMSMRQEGEALHKAGKHAESTKVLSQALKAMGM